MLTKKITQLFFFFCLPIFAFAESLDLGSLKGTVLDKSNQPIVGASVVLKSTVRGVTTNEQGEYLLKNVETGTFTLVISSLGFQTIEKSVNILRGQTETINVTLVNIRLAHWS